MSSLTPRARCRECGNENIVSNSQSTDPIWEMCHHCGKYTTQVMINIVKQVPIELVTDDTPKADELSADPDIETEEN